MTQYYNRENDKAKRQTLRKTMPPAEVRLWQRLRQQQLGGHKFRRQYSVGPYILDFYCAQAKLAIEVDGESHYQPGAQLLDEKRQQFVESFGIWFLRFTNVEIYDNLDGVLEVILATINDRREKEPHPTSP